MPDMTERNNVTERLKVVLRSTCDAYFAEFFSAPQQIFRTFSII